METSKQPRGIFKGHYVDSSPQRRKLRFSDIEQALQYEDSLEPDVRYVDSVKVARSEQRARTQPRGMGKDAGDSED